MINVLWAHYRLSDKARMRSSEDETKPPANLSAVGMKYGLSTLSHPGNPLTNSGSLNPAGRYSGSSYLCQWRLMKDTRAEYIWSCTSGHQRSEVSGGGNVAAYQMHRNKRIEDQQEPPETNIFRGCRIYCNSEWLHLPPTVDVDWVLKHRWILRRYDWFRAQETSYQTWWNCGVRIQPSSQSRLHHTRWFWLSRHNETSATHILTSMTLSGAKVQRFLTSSKNKQQVVKPEWLFDSITLGKEIYKLFFVDIYIFG